MYFYLTVKSAIIFVAISSRNNSSFLAAIFLISILSPARLSCSPPFYTPLTAQRMTWLPKPIEQVNAYGFGVYIRKVLV